MTVALVALAAALLVLAPPQRMAPEGRAPARPFGGSRWTVWAVAVLAVAATLPPTAAVAAGIVGATIALRGRRARLRERRRAEAAALQAGLDVVAGELRAGSHPVVAFETAAGEVGGGVAVALRAVAARARLGVDVSDGLRSAATESTVPTYWDRLAVCWELAHRHGLAIAVLMRAAHRDLVERARFESRVTAGMAGARTTATVLAVLPVLGIGLGQLVGAEPFRFLLSGGLGGWLLVIGAVLSCVGLLWSDRITAGTVA